MSITVTIGLCGLIWLVWKSLSQLQLKTSLDNIPGPKPRSILTGHMIALFDRHGGWQFNQDISEKYGPVVRLHGLLRAKILYVFDPAALQHLLSQEGVSYSFSASQLASNGLAFGPGVISVRGEQHRRQRKLLTPAFSTENIRKLMPDFQSITHELHRTIWDIVKDSPQEVDVLRWLSSAALEFVALGVMGKSFNSISGAEGQAYPFVRAIKDAAPITTQLTVWWMLSEYWQKLGSPQFRKRLADLTIAIIPDKNLRRMRDIINTMDSETRTFFQDIKSAAHEDQAGSTYEDPQSGSIMSTLIRDSRLAETEDRLTDEELLAQISTMFLAGTDTTSGILARMLHLLAIHPHLQDRLRQELETSKDYAEQVLTYERLTDLPFLDAICKETFRLYPPTNLIPREALEDVVMPLQYPIEGLDGKLIYEIVVPKGTLILPSYRSCNTYKAIWGEDAQDWKPERWLSPLPSAVLEAHIPGIYSNTMTFAGGYRSCIGIRLALLETKMVLASLVSSFKFSLSNKPIFWNWCPITYPSMDPVKVEPSLVLRVEAIASA